MAPITAVVLGAGARGNAYAEFALRYPESLRIVAVAEPDPARRERFASKHGLSAQQCYPDWQDLLGAGKLANAVINTTMDRTHYTSTLAALDAGYDVLLEKPMSPILGESVQLVKAAEQQGRLLQICHVLRYAPFFQKLREIIDSGVLGRIISVDHRENLSYWHMAHSYVRGNWSNLGRAAPMILAKCSHDFDILVWLLRRDVNWLQSFGSLTHFRPENAPHSDVPLRCTDGCPVAEHCKYDATRIYGTDRAGSIYDILTPIRTVEARLEALKTSPYGRCVYRCDNNVVDHQVVNMEFDDQLTVSLIMNGQGYEEGRSLRIDGTKATLTGKFSEPYKLNVYHHHSKQKEVFPVDVQEKSGHGGGDLQLVRSFVNALQGTSDPSITTARVSLESHLLAFAAEESRLNHTVIDMRQYRQQAENL
jgi:predicted dehydrogenase